VQGSVSIVCDTEPEDERASTKEMCPADYSIHPLSQWDNCHSSQKFKSQTSILYTSVYIDSIKNKCIIQLVAKFSSTTSRVTKYAVLPSDLLKLHDRYHLNA
jgi:hypothetical protein